MFAYHPEPAWLIEADAFGSNSEPIKTAIRRLGMKCEVVQPRLLLMGLDPEVAKPNNPCVIFWGAYSLMRHIQLHRNWVPGGWCQAEEFDCERYYPHFGNHLLNDRFVTLEIDDAIANLPSLFHQFALNDQVFARPCGVEKIFTGRCMTQDELRSTLRSSQFAGGRVLLSRIRPIGREWRLVVSDGAIVAASQYFQAGQKAIIPGCPDEVRDFAEHLLDHLDWEPDPIFMLDVCESIGKLKVLELNSFSCSGFYACDPIAIVSKASELATAAWSEHFEKPACAV